MTLALDLTRALNCESPAPPCGECTACQKIASRKHADVQIISLAGDGNSVDTRAPVEISIDQIRQVQHSACLPPFEGRYKVFIIDGAELLSNEAANCLLKTLEEPAGRVIFILLTNNERLLPATVISRCQRLELPPSAVTEVEAVLNSGWGIELPQARLLARFSHGCLGWALSAVSDGGLLEQRAKRMERLVGIIDADREERFAHALQLATQFSRSRIAVQEVLDLWRDYWRDLLLIRVGCSSVITNTDMLALLTSQAKDYSLAQIKGFISSIQMAGEQLRQSANPQLVFEVLMLSIPERG
jgi:DNA polymerase-3 subunit delta'